MKFLFKISARERWALAFAPAIVIIGFYSLDYVNSLNTTLEKARKRVSAAMVPLPPPAPSAALTQAKAALENTKKEIAARTEHIGQLQQELNALSDNAAAAADDREPGRVIEHVEAIFARNDITPLISEPAGDGGRTDGMPTALLNVLAPKMNVSGSHKVPRVWHCIFNDTTPNFDRSLREITNEIPAAIPLSFNLVYDPSDDGETRLLELWLLY